VRPQPAARWPGWGLLVVVAKKKEKRKKILTCKEISKKYLGSKEILLQNATPHERHEHGKASLSPRLVRP
jgi:hypothetical protein